MIRALRAFGLSAILLAVSSWLLAETFGAPKRMPRPDEFGDVVMDEPAEGEAPAGVVFEHWSHRMRYTCRLCHVDLGFAMQAGATGVLAEDIRAGLYCGACHDGRIAFEARCAEGNDEETPCTRCHSLGRGVSTRKAFYEAVQDFPRARFGNRVDWLRAEETGLIELVDYLEGHSIRRKRLEDPADLDLDAKVAGMPDILFSHRKHAVWNGCELCHPQIFGVKKTGTVYSMQDIFDGRFCGACHGKVAFMNLDCQLCHVEDVL